MHAQRSLLSHDRSQTQHSRSCRIVRQGETVKCIPGLTLSLLISYSTRSWADHTLVWTKVYLYYRLINSISGFHSHPYVAEQYVKAHASLQELAKFVQLIIKVTELVSLSLFLGRKMRRRWWRFTHLWVC